MCYRFALLTAWTALLAGCIARTDRMSEQQASSSATVEPRVRVVPGRPQRKTLVRRAEQPGYVEPFQAAPLTAKIAGYVTKVHVDIGDRVVGPKYEGDELIEPGQILAEVAAPELEEELRQKKAVVARSEAEIGQAQAAIRVAEAGRTSAQAEVAEARAAAERVEADVARWRSELSRVSELAARKAVTERLLDETRSQFRAAEAARQEVAAKISSAEARLQESDARIEKAQADCRAAEAQLQVSRSDEQRLQDLLDYTRIRAPFDGLVAARNVDPGHLVSATSPAPLLEVVQVHVVRVFVDVPEIDAVLTQPGSEALIRVPSLGTRSIPATVTRTAWILSPGSRTLRTEIDLPNDDGQLRPGMYVYADLKVAERPAALVIAKTAIMTQDGQTYCWQIDASGKVVRTPVTTGLASGGEVEIIDGLRGGEAIVEANPTVFREGQMVEVVSPAPPAAGK